MKKGSTSRRYLARAMRAFFYLLYQPLAWSYDLVAALVSVGRWRAWVLAVLPYLEGPRLLELGHGPGHLQAALNERGFFALGIDASRQMGRQTRKRLRRKGYMPRVVTGYAQHLPFAANTFTSIVATFPTEYITQPETLAEAYRALQSGGTLVVLPAAWITGKRLLERGAAALFRVTGQAPDWDERWLEPFSRAGFRPRAEMITRQSWELVVILAEKPPEG